MSSTFVFFVVISLCQASDSCLKPNITWLSVDILDTLHPVPDPYQCQAICGDTEDCAAFTWTTADNQELELHCFLFSSVANQTSFDECVSGPDSCTCSSEVACHGDAGNIVEEIDDVETEAECQRNCQENLSCMFYTWRNGATFPPYYCVLLSHCEDTVPCHGCFSGPQECSEQILTTTSTPTIEGIVISGGGGAYRSVEVFSPTDDKKSCVLPSLPDERSGHTMDSLEICGGCADPDHPCGTMTTCINFTSGQWVTSHALLERRRSHTSWSTEAGTVLIGGYNSAGTTEIITEGEYEGVPAFDLQYKIWGACSIVDSDTMVLTGGYDFMRSEYCIKVSRYNTAGYVEELPSLNEGRHSHGCGIYAVDSGDQVYLVTGGWNGLGYLSSTELLTSSTSSWSMANNLPRSMAGIRGVTLGGVLYMTGGRYDNKHNVDVIYQWTGDDWEKVGKMKMARSFHAVSTIRMDDDAIQFCE